MHFTTEGTLLVVGLRSLAEQTLILVCLIIEVVNLSFER